MRNAACIAAVFVLLVSNAHAANSQQQKLDATLKNLAQSKQTEAELAKKLAATEAEMQKLREQSTALAEKLQQSERSVSTQEDALAKANTEYATKRAEFELRKADYTKTVLSLIRMHQLPPTVVFSSAQDAQTLLRSASVLEKTNSVVAEKAARLRSDMNSIRTLQGEIKRRDLMTREERTKLAKQQASLKSALNQRQNVQSRLNADHARAQAKVAELSRQSASLQELIGKLAAHEKADPSPKSSVKLRDFDSSKGSARAPVAGDVIHHFGDKQNGNSTYRGMVFKTRAGATVVSPYDGEVVFTGPFRDYGNMVLIKHKNGYISLIAGLSTVSASVNQAALRGEPVGSMPATGSGEAYVELRGSDAKPIDPADWFANVVAKSAR